MRQFFTNSIELMWTHTTNKNHSKLMLNDRIQQSFVEKTFIQYINIECQNIEEKLANKKYSVLKREEKGREQAQTK